MVGGIEVPARGMRGCRGGRPRCAAASSACAPPRPPLPLLSPGPGRSFEPPEELLQAVWAPASRRVTSSTIPYFHPLPRTIITPLVKRRFFSFRAASAAATFAVNWSRVWGLRCACQEWRPVVFPMYDLSVWC